MTELLIAAIILLFLFSVFDSPTLLLVILLVILAVNDQNVQCGPGMIAEWTISSENVTQTCVSVPEPTETEDE